MVLNEDPEDYDVVDNAEEEEVIFDSASSAAGSNESSSHNETGLKHSVITNSGTADGARSQITQQNEKFANESASSSATTPLYKVDDVIKSDLSADSIGGADYEFVPSSGGDDELDELEAEIAAALDD